MKNLSIFLVLWFILSEFISFSSKSCYLLYIFCGIYICVCVHEKIYEIYINMYFIYEWHCKWYWVFNFKFYFFFTDFFLLIDFCIYLITLLSETLLNYFFSFLFFFFPVLGFEIRALPLLGRYSTTWASPQAFNYFYFLVVIAFCCYSW
jgi:hypothetical protein